MSFGLDDRYNIIVFIIIIIIIIIIILLFLAPKQIKEMFVAQGDKF